MAQHLLGPDGFIDYIESDDGFVTLFWANLPYFCFRRDDDFTRNLGIGLLATSNISWKKIMEIFRVGRNTVNRVKKIYQEKGSSGLHECRRGRKRTDDDIENYVIKRFIELEDVKGHCEIILGEIDRLYAEGRFRTTIKKTTLYAIIEDFRMQRDWIADSEPRRTSEADAEHAGDDGAEPDERPETGKEIVLDVSHGGALAVLPLLSELGIADHLPEPDARPGRGGFTNGELVFAYAMLNAAGAVEVEQNFLHGVDDEMGGIIGRSGIPSLSTYRNRIPEIVDGTDLERLSFETSRRAHEMFSFSHVVYIDGHFMPYHGGAHILKDYWPQRRLAAAGRVVHFVHDENGNPVFSALSDGYQRFRHHIASLHEKLKKLYGVGKRGLLEIFDRGGWANDFFVENNDEIRFLCWRLEPAECERPVDAEWIDVTLERQGNEVGKPEFEIVQACEKKLELTHSESKEKALLRAVWIRKGDKESPAATNDFDLELEDVVRHLTRRWGAQENMFKQAIDHGINKIHSYKKMKYTEEFLYEEGLESRKDGIRRTVDNPEMTASKKKRTVLKKELDKIIIKIQRASERKDEKAGRALCAERARLEKDVRSLDEKIKKTAEKILLMKKIEDEEVVRLAPGKKRFFDCMKICAIWSKRSIVEIVKPVYGNLRDVNKFVDRILRCRTRVTIREKTAYVEFPDLFTKKETEVLRSLCETLNNYDKIRAGLRFNRVIFQCR